jgi:hypothetical protein
MHLETQAKTAPTEASARKFRVLARHAYKGGRSTVKTVLHAPVSWTGRRARARLGVCAGAQQASRQGAASRGPRLRALCGLCRHWARHSRLGPFHCEGGNGAPDRSRTPRPDPKPPVLRLLPPARGPSREHATGAAKCVQSRLRDFSQRWSRATSRWKRGAAPLHGVRVIEHHKGFSRKALFAPLPARESSEGGR